MKKAVSVISAALILACVLGGCTQKIWMKDGASVEQVKRDWWECKNKVYQAWGGRAQTEIGPAISAQSDLAECMQAHGYYQCDPSSDSRCANITPVSLSP